MKSPVAPPSRPADADQRFPKNLPTLLFFSGLGADSQLFAMQKKCFPNLIAPDWPVPSRNEPLDDYLRRWLEQLPLSKNVIVGGCSFGGLIALRVAKMLNAKYCVLFGSIKRHDEIPRRLRWSLPLHYFAHRWLIRFWQSIVAGFLRTAGRSLSPSAQSVLKQFSRLDPILVKWSLRQLNCCLKNLPSPENNITNSPRFDPLSRFPNDDPTDIDLPDGNDSLHIVQIHGGKDRVFPSRLLRQQSNTTIHILPHAGHLLTLFESAPVNQIIGDIIQQNSTRFKTLTDIAQEYDDRG